MKNWIWHTLKLSSLHQTVLAKVKNCRSTKSRNIKTWSVQGLMRYRGHPSHINAISHLRLKETTFVSLIFLSLLREANPRSLSIQSLGGILQHYKVLCLVFILIWNPSRNLLAFLHQKHPPTLHLPLLGVALFAFEILLVIFLDLIG